MLKIFFFAKNCVFLLKSNFLPKIFLKIFFTNEGTYASVKSLLSRDYMHHVDLRETRKSPKG
jgi:hypothetical protein